MKKTFFKIHDLVYDAALEVICDYADDEDYFSKFTGIEYTGYSYIVHVDMEWHNRAHASYSVEFPCEGEITIKEVLTHTVAAV